MKKKGFQGQTIVYLKVEENVDFCHTHHILKYTVLYTQALHYVRKKAV